MRDCVQSVKIALSLFLSSKEHNFSKKITRCFNILIKNVQQRERQRIPSPNTQLLPLVRPMALRASQQSLEHPLEHQLV